MVSCEVKYITLMRVLRFTSSMVSNFSKKVMCTVCIFFSGFEGINSLISILFRFDSVEGGHGRWPESFVYYAHH